MEPERLNIWSLRTFCLITGSSRGLGKRMAVRFAQLLPQNSVIVLAARDSKGLTTAKQNIEEVRGKAARDMMFLTMALEQPHILVLNYAPGPLDTAMQLEARTKTGDPELQTMFQTMHAEGRLLSCDQTLDRLIEILNVNRFDSGAHIDYYDD